MTMERLPPVGSIYSRAIALDCRCLPRWKVEHSGEVLVPSDVCLSPPLLPLSAGVASPSVMIGTAPSVVDKDATHHDRTNPS